MQLKKLSRLSKFIGLASMLTVASTSSADFFPYSKTDFTMKVTNSSARQIKIYFNYKTQYGTSADNGEYIYETQTQSFAGTKGETKTFSDITLYGLQMKMRAKILFTWESGRIYYEGYDNGAVDRYSSMDLTPGFIDQKSTTDWINSSYVIDSEAQTNQKGCYYVYEVGKVNIFHRKC